MEIIKSSNNQELIDTTRIDAIFERAASYIDYARQGIQRSIDVEMIKAYWLIGKEIVEEEHIAKGRAKYGKEILKGLSNRLQLRYKRGFSVDLLEKTRKFYLVYHEDD